LVLSDKERFVYHFSSTIGLIEPHEIESFISHIVKHRCRSLDMKKVKDIVEDMREEMLLSKIMWEEM
tara:strand:+ start:4713 stop:4913 length:201 start_codon:yes stop_codon:yes gene_type:complete